MDFRQVEYFLAVTDRGQVLAASDRLGVSQPTISRAVRSLERELGTTLFHRLGRGVVPTAAGRALIGPGHQILQSVRAAEERIRATAGELVGRIDLVGLPELMAGPIVDHIAEFKVRHPKVSIRLSELKDDEIVASLIHERRCDFVLTHFPTVPQIDFDVHLLGQQEFVLVFPLETKLDPGPIPLDNFPQLPFVLASRDTSIGESIEAEIRRCGSRPNIAVLIDHCGSRLPMVLTGVGGSIIDKSVAEKIAHRTIVRPCAPPLVRDFGLCYNSATLSPTAEAFLGLISLDLS